MTTKFQIHCNTIPHSKQRYDTAGDWFTPQPHHIAITVSAMSDPRYEQVVALHEVVEALLCMWTDVSDHRVTEWDTHFPTGSGEPGDDPAAPYCRQHVIASAIERLAADLLGVDWNAYSREVDSL